MDKYCTGLSYFLHSWQRPGKHNLAIQYLLDTLETSTFLDNALKYSSIYIKHFVNNPYDQLVCIYKWNEILIKSFHFSSILCLSKIH